VDAVHARRLSARACRAAPLPASENLDDLVELP
jgi:hypothetical protein